MYEKGDLVSRVLIENSERRKKQIEAPIEVIIGNPPYSVGQGNANDNAANIGYPGLDARIRETYTERSSSGMNAAL